MMKAIAILNVVAWSGFWAFGYLAFTSGTESGGQMVMATLLAAIGGAVGLWAYFQLVRHAEATGYAKPARRAARAHEDNDMTRENT